MSYFNHEMFNPDPVGNECDNCGKKTYEVDGFVIPKGWIAILNRPLKLYVHLRTGDSTFKRLEIAPKLGDVYLHFCSKNCFIIFMEKKMEELDKQEEVIER